MKTLKQIFLGFVMVVGLSFAVSAQRSDDQKKPPPKDPKETPKVNPREKPPPRNPREDKPKKPGSEFSILLINKDGYLA
jgi:hypothetical protein